MVRVAFSRKRESFDYEVMIDFNSNDQTGFKQAITSRLNAMPSSNRSSYSYVARDSPFAVLSKLEEIGYKVVTANTTEKNSDEVWQMWTLHKQA